MIQSNDTGLTPQDAVLMAVVHAMKNKKKGGPLLNSGQSETIRESVRGRPKYPVVSLGNVNGANDKRKLINYAFSKSYDVPRPDFRRLGVLDTSQVEDRRTPKDKIMELLMAMGAMAGDGRLGRPAPNQMGPFLPGAQGRGNMGGY